MSGSVDTTIEQLKALDRSRQYSELAERLKRLPPNLTQSDLALVAYWQGKLAILDGDDARAIASLARAVALAPDNPASHYLLGAALARAQQWLDARTALLRALELQPALEAARLELAAVHLALGHPHAAARLLAPLPDRPEGRLRGLRATAAVQVEPDPRGAASLAAAALVQNSRLPQSLLIDWLRFTGGLLLTSRFSEGRAWLEALTLVTPSAAAIANPVPRRIALIAWLLLEALEPGTMDLRPWCQQLDQLCWLLPSTAEHQLWDAWLESWVTLVMGRLENLPSRDAGRVASLLKSVSAALQVIQSPRRNNAGLFLRLDQLRQGMQPDPISGDDDLVLALQRQRHRLLVLNVFFALNSIGGATRIAQDQVRALCDQFGDDWEVTVLCTDPAPWMQIEPLELSPEDEREVWELDQPLPVEVHQWHGARVVRLTLPPRSWTHYHDRSVESFCRRWFPQARFDLIHSHCIQVLGVGPLQVARELGIPYAITLHDGWWLSPWLFLLTPAGKAIDVSDPLSHLDDSAKQDKRREQAALDRNHCLREVLQGAKARWAVSEAFADLHRDAGVADVTVMENRWQPMPPDGVRRARSADQPLRCCYVGGLAAHKGYAVLQAAVLQARPADPGLELTVIDSSLKPGEWRMAVWSSTPVRFVASVPMDQMSAFYAEQDVLLAPSIWPESYGLVSREALSAGLWVVASEIGALADPIRDGENGHRLPAGDVRALIALLEQLSSQHPQPQPLLSFAGERVPLYEELSRHYEALL